MTIDAQPNDGGRVTGGGPQDEKVCHAEIAVLRAENARLHSEIRRIGMIVELLAADIIASADVVEASPPERDSRPRVS